MVKNKDHKYIFVDKFQVQDILDKKCKILWGNGLVDESCERVAGVTLETKLREKYIKTKVNMFILEVIANCIVLVKVTGRFPHQ